MLVIVQIEKPRGKSFLQVLRQTRAKGGFWSSEGPEVCGCATDEHHCPFHTAQQICCICSPRGRRQGMAPGENRCTFLHIKRLSSTGSKELNERRAGITEERGLDWNSWALLQALPILLESLTAHQKRLGICFKN